MGLISKNEVIKALDSKEILITPKKVITSAMECADFAAFTFAKTPKLKIAGDNVNLGLCDSRDYFKKIVLYSLCKQIKFNGDF